MHQQRTDHYRADIDGLRAVSILFVLIYHGFPALMPGGFVGVDVFFVISGYLITGIILRGLKDQRFSLLHFYRRRVQRILPAVILVLFACLLVGWFALLPGEYSMLGKHSAAASLFVPNFIFWSESGYFDPAAELKPLLHLWSLGVEEQFYLAWPLLLLLAGKWRGGALVFVIALSLGSFTYGIVNLGEDSAAAFFLPHYRAWEPLLGALLAWVTLSRSALVTPGGTQEAVAAGGLFMLLAATQLINADLPFPGWWAPLPTLGATAIIAAGQGSRVAGAVLANPLMVWIGKISFPLYLWHWPLLSFARIVEEGEPSAGIRLAALALAVVLSALSYHLVERRLRYHRATWVPFTLLALLLGLGLAGLAIYKGNGFPARLPEISKKLEMFEWGEKGLYFRDDCSKALDLPGRCLSNGHPQNHVVIGDSHSTNVFLALEHHYRGSEEGVMRLGHRGCPPFYNLASARPGNRDHCKSKMNKLLDYALGSEDISRVYLSLRGTLYIAASGESPERVLKFTGAPHSKSNRRAMQLAMERTLEQLLEAGKEVVYVLSWPELGFDPRSCLDLRPLKLTATEPRPCFIPRAQFNRENGPYRKLVFSVLAKYPQVKIWDTAQLFCDREKCQGQRNGLMLFRDHSHLTLQGSQLLGEKMKVRTQSGR